MNKFFRITLALVAAFAASGAQAARNPNCADGYTHMPYLRHGEKVGSVEELIGLMKDGGQKLHAGVSKEMLRDGVRNSVAVATGLGTGADQKLTDEQLYKLLSGAKIVGNGFDKTSGVYVHGINCETNKSERLVRMSHPGEQFIAIRVGENQFARVVSTTCANPIDDVKGFAMAGNPPATQVTAPGGVIINNYNIQQVAPATRIEPIPQTGTRIEAIPQVAVVPTVAYAAPQVGYGYGGVSVWPQVALGLGMAYLNRPQVVTSPGYTSTSTWTSNYSTVYNTTTINRTGGPVLGPTGPGSTVGGPVLGNTGNFNTGRPVLGPTGAVGGGPVLR